ncbi:hypothetical protein RBB78_14520 [Tunturiibacter empetritectus]|uniref:hypothetical protein n=1 Tax=Tunturiibacter empetritectus TaxID=3069691 RepID=UPI003D9AC07E
MLFARKNLADLSSAFVAFCWVFCRGLTENGCVCGGVLLVRTWCDAWLTWRKNSVDLGREKCATILNYFFPWLFRVNPILRLRDPSFLPW